MSGYDRRIYALMLSATTFVLNFTLIQPIFSLFLTSRGLTVVELGVLLSVQNFIPLILRIPLSGVVVRLGRLRSMIIGLLSAGVASLMFIYSQTYLHFLAAIIVNSVTASSFNQTAMSTVSDAAPADRQGDAMGRYLTFLGLGMLVGPAVCSSLVERIGYTGMFWLAGGVPFIGVLLLVFMAPSNIREREVKPEKEEAIGIGESLGMILRNRNVVLLSYCRASFSAAQSLFLALFSIYAVKQLGFSESAVATLFTVRGFANMVSRYPAGNLSDKVGRKPLMLGAYGLLVVSFVMLAFTQSYLLLGVALGLYGLCWGTRAVSEWAFLTDLVEPEIKTISISYLASIFSLGSTLGSVTSGILTLYLPFSTIFLIGAVLNFGAIPAILIMKKDS